MIGNPPMCQFMNDDVRQNGWWQEEERGIEHDDAACGTAAPLGGGEANADIPKRNTERLLIDLVHEPSHAILLSASEE